MSPPPRAPPQRQALTPYRVIRTCRRRLIPAATAAGPPRRQNFLLCVFDAQYGRRLQHEDGSRSTLGAIDIVANRIFTAVFAIELLLNFYANWPERFLSNGWNWLDCGIVGMSLITDLGNFPDWRVRPFEREREGERNCGALEGNRPDHTTSCSVRLPSQPFVARARRVAPMFARITSPPQPLDIYNTNPRKG